MDEDATELRRLRSARLLLASIILIVIGVVTCVVSFALDPSRPLPLLAAALAMVTCVYFVRQYRAMRRR
jgi:cytochrome c biogenesis factor